jgi:hypothetical protein
MTGPRWDVNAQPCPNCGEKALVYDGSVKWRSGSRPPRSLATKGSLGSSPRADFEIVHYLHCANCQTHYYDYINGRKPQLTVDREAKTGSTS